MASECKVRIEEDLHREIIRRECAKIILSTDAFQLSLEQPITFSFGLESPVKVVADCISSNPHALRRTVNLLSLLMDLEHLQPDVVVGVISGALPFAHQLAKLKGCRFAARVGHRRTEAQTRQIEGIINPGENVLVFDDVATSGGNIILATNDIRQKEGAVVTDCLTIFDYDLAQARTNFTTVGIQPHSAIAFIEFLTLTQGRLSSDEIEALRSWYKNAQQASAGLYVAC